MAFLRVDDSAYDADSPVSAALVQRVAGNVRVAWEDRTPGATCVYDYRDPLQLHGVPRGYSSQLRGVIPYLWRLHPDDTEVTLRVRCTGAGGATTTLGVAVQSLSELGNVIPPNTDSDTVSSGSSATVTLTADVTDLSGWCVVWLTATSAEGTEEYWIDATEVYVGASWVPLYVILDTSNSEVWSSSGAFAEGRAPYKLTWGTADKTGGTVDTGDFDGDDQTRQPPLPEARLALRHATVSGENRVYVWPPFQTGDGGLNSDLDSWDIGGKAADEDLIARTPLAYAKIHGVELRTSATDSLPAIGSSFDAGERVSAWGAWSLYRDGEGTWVYRTPVYAVGTCPDGVADAIDSSVYGLADPGHGRTELDLSGTRDYVTFAKSPVGRIPYYKVDPTGSTSYHLHYEVGALLVFTGFRGNDNREGVINDLLIRVSVTDRDGSSNAATNTTLLQGVPFHARKRAPTQTDTRLGAYWLSFWGDDASGYAKARHSLSGAMPEDLATVFKWVPVSLEVTDDQPGTNARLLSLACKVDAGDSSLGNLITGRAGHVHNLAWHVGHYPTNVDGLLQ